MDENTQRDLCDLATTLGSACRLANTQQRYILGITVGRESLALFRELRDRQGCAETLLALATSYRARMEYGEARILVEESLALFQSVGAQSGIARALSCQASIVSYYQQHRRALALAEESLAIWRGLGENWEIAEQLYQVAELALHLNEYAHAQQRVEECLVLAQKIEYHRVYAYALYALARVELHWYGLPVARSRYEESLAMHRALRNEDGIALILCDLAHHAWLQEELETAQELCEQSTTLFLQRLNYSGLINSLGQLSYIALANGKLHWGVRLLAASDAVRETIGLPPNTLKGAYGRAVTKMRTPLAWREFVHSWHEGRGMTPEEVFQQRTEHPFVSAKRAHSQSRLGQENSLTDREREVLSWLARGLTNRQIAEQLVISPVTVNAHVRSIYTKIQVSSRSAATHYAFTSHLVE